MKTISIIILSVLFSLSSMAQGLKPGDKAVEFSLKNVDGKNVALADYKDAKGVILIFTCNHCPFAKMYEARIIELQSKYASKGFPVVAISSNDAKAEPDDSFENMAKLASEKKYTFPYLYDESQAIAKSYGAQRTPHVFLLKKSGSDFIVEFIGSIDDNAQDAKAAKDKYVEKAIDEILAGKTVTIKTVKAIGCGIKWKS